jgi:NADPH-dependent 2,4-dienoyl-CoA reductase/sulfur reductase-like enzyme
MTPDIIIMGAGPAGLAAAVEARAHGASVLLLDEGAGPGGRVWQAIEQRPAKNRDDDLAQRVVRDFRGCGADARFGATVWAIEGATVFWSEAGAARSATGGTIIVATGTTERPMPIPGWTLPGVMTVGAAQILLKTAGLAPQGRVWIAGQGPLLLLYAVQALEAGGAIAGILDVGRPGNAAPHLLGALASPSALAKGLAWRQRIRRAGVPWLIAEGLEATGDGRLERIGFRTGGAARVEDADTLLLHDGVIPSVQISRALGCAHEWDAAQACWRPVTDAWGQSSAPGVAIAGDGAGVGGWEAAMLSGRIAALGALARLGIIGVAARDRAARPLLVQRRRRMALRPLLDALYPPLRRPIADSTVVCRCEEATAGQVRAAVGLGCLGLNQLKAFTRAGMGPCQGRMCGPTLAAVVAEARGVEIETVDALRLRFPTKPLTVGELAALDQAALDGAALDGAGQ